MNRATSPDDILEIGFAFRKSRALLSAVELGVFTALGEGPLTQSALAGQLGVHERGARDFFDTLVTLGLLERSQVGRYGNTAVCSTYLDARQPAYLGGLFEYLNERMYPAWTKLTAALRTGKPQAGPSAAGGFSTFYADGAVAETFLKGMTGASLLVGEALAANFPWADYGSFVDVGTAQGCVPVAIAQAHPHLRGSGFDLASVEGAFTSYVRERGMEQRVSFRAGDFFKEALPQADVVIMGRVLHNWDVPVREMLVAKACTALPCGGVLIVHDTLIDNARQGRPHCMLSSLNMLLQTSGGSEYTAEDCTGWMRNAGFAETRVFPLAAMQTAVVAVKA